MVAVDSTELIFYASLDSLLRPPPTHLPENSILDGTAAFAVVQSTANIGVSGILGKIREGLDEERRCEKHPASPGSPPPSLRRRIAINHMEVLSA